MIGIHGNTPTPAHPEPEVIERVRFSNIDVLEHDEDDPEYEGAIGITSAPSDLLCQQAGGARRRALELRGV